MQELHKQEMISNLRRYTNSIPPFFCKSIFLFGHCNAAEELADYLLSINIEPLCFLDNSLDKQGGNYKGIPINEPNFINSYSDNNSIVLIANRYYAPMRQQLLEMGYNGEIVETVEYSSFQEFSTSDYTFNKKVNRVQNGHEHFEKIRQSWKEEYLIVCPYKALGDVYWAMTYLDAYLEQNNIKSYAVIVVGNPCREVVKLFGIEKIAVFDQKTMDSIIQYLVFTHDKNSIIAQHDHLYTDTSFKILSHQFIHFSNYFRDVVFGLPETAEETIPNFAAELSCKLNMPKGRSVILAPYANSIVEAPMVFWEELAENYAKDGYTVYTNIIPSQEPVKCTIPLILPISEIIPAVEWAGTFISIRSGLCDVVHRANCEKILVFPDCYFSTTKHKICDFFSLKGWKTILL